MTDDLELTEQQRLQIFYSFVEVGYFDCNIADQAGWRMVVCRLITCYAYSSDERVWEINLIKTSWCRVKHVLETKSYNISCVSFPKFRCYSLKNYNITLRAHSPS